MILPFESKLPHHYSTRNRFTETPLINPGAGTNLEACNFSMPRLDLWYPITISVLRGSIPSDKLYCVPAIRCLQRRCHHRKSLNIAYLPEARILIIEILVFFFHKRNYHGHGFASIAFVMTTALVMGVTPLRPQ